MAPDVRVVTFNIAAGNPRITTPPEALLDLPFYREAFAGGPAAPLLALQEVGDVHARALRGATVLQLRRPGLGNALVVPDRYEILQRRSGYYVLPHLRGIGRALRAGRRNWRQYGELRMWIQARLRDREAGRELTVLNTHISFDSDLNGPQLDAVLRRATNAGPPVVLAGDLNTTRLPGGLTDVDPAREKLDYVLAAGLEPVSVRTWSELVATGVSDHAAVDATLRYLE